MPIAFDPPPDDTAADDIAPPDDAGAAVRRAEARTPGPALERLPRVSAIADVATGDAPAGPTADDDDD